MVTGEGYRDLGISTLREPRSPKSARRDRNVRRVALAGMAVLVIAALAGFLGPRTSTVHASDGPVGMTVDYTQVTRPGLAAPFEVIVHRDGGFDGPIQLAFDSDLFRRLDFQSWYPTPSSETADGERVIYEFDPPPAGETLRVGLDAHTQPTQFPSARRYTVAVLEEDAVVISVDFRVWVMP